MHALGSLLKDVLSELTSVLSRHGTVLLDTAASDTNDRDRSLLFTRPVREIVARSESEVVDAFRAVDKELDRGLYVAGYVGYESGYAFESRFGNFAAAHDPLLWFGVYDEPLVLPRESLSVRLAHKPRPFSVKGPRLSVDRERYEDAIRTVRQHIREGDVYQINYTAPFTFDFSGDPVTFYGALRRVQPVAYAAFINRDDTLYLSLSPELFFKRDGDRITVQPMKGTAHTADGAARAGEMLRNDPKNRAENLMIVDLLRNDLSICCEAGSVQVTELFGVHQFPSVLQMTSTIEGHLKAGVTYEDLFSALFPSGSVTGAPKIRAMEIIRQLESQPRGVYCGSIGYAGPDGKSAFNVAIRTIALKGSRGVMGTGSGIVWDSDADAEYEECLLKTRFVQIAAE